MENSEAKRSPGDHRLAERPLTEHLLEEQPSVECPEPKHPAALVQPPAAEQPTAVAHLPVVAEHSSVAAEHRSAVHQAVGRPERECPRVAHLSVAHLSVAFATAEQPGVAHPTADRRATGHLNSQGLGKNQVGSRRSSC